MLKSLTANNSQSVLHPFDSHCDSIAVRSFVENFDIVADRGERVERQNNLLHVAAPNLRFCLAYDASLVQNCDVILDRFDFIEQVRTVKSGSHIGLQMRNQIAVELLANDRVEPQ